MRQTPQALARRKSAENIDDLDLLRYKPAGKMSRLQLGSRNGLPASPHYRELREGPLRTVTSAAPLKVFRILRSLRHFAALRTVTSAAPLKVVRGQAQEMILHCTPHRHKCGSVEGIANRST